MPISKYYSGHGEEVMQKMKKQYGKRGEEVFYATANKMKKMKHRKRPSGSGMFTMEEMMKGYRKMRMM